MNVWLIVLLMYVVGSLLMLGYWVAVMCFEKYVARLRNQFSPEPLALGIVCAFLIYAPVFNIIFLVSVGWRWVGNMFKRWKQHRQLCTAIKQDFAQFEQQRVYEHH